MSNDRIEGCDQYKYAFSKKNYMMNFSDNPIQKPIYIVSGLPRSGTSMMMRMLSAGGIELDTDGKRAPDQDNPDGYFEYKLVKRLPENGGLWLVGARGKAIKIVSTLLPFLPPNNFYCVIFMHRSISEILLSQRQMLINQGNVSEEPNEENLSMLFEDHILNITDWIERQPNFNVLHVNYNELMDNPENTLNAIGHFLNVEISKEEMALIINQKLYRQRISLK